jgi:hypothetical protein
MCDGKLVVEQVCATIEGCGGVLSLLVGRNRNVGLFVIRGDKLADETGATSAGKAVILEWSVSRASP